MLAKRLPLAELLEQDSITLHCMRCEKPIEMPSDGFKSLVDKLFAMGWTKSMLDGLIDWPISCVEDCELSS